VVREEVRGAAIGDWETVEMWVPVKEVTPKAEAPATNTEHKRAVTFMMSILYVAYAAIVRLLEGMGGSR